jgi:hypothetical protein
MYSDVAVLETDVEVPEERRLGWLQMESCIPRPEASCHARREDAGQISPATFDSLQDLESVRMANAEVSG